MSKEKNKTESLESKDQRTEEDVDKILRPSALVWRSVRRDKAALVGFVMVLFLIIVSIFFVGSILMVLLGIIGEYIGEIFEEVKGRPNYVIEDQINFD